VELGFGDLGRGLFAVKDLKPGDIALSVPIDHCLLMQLEAAQAGLEPQKVEDKQGNVKMELAEFQRKQLIWVVELILSMELTQKALVSSDPGECWSKENYLSLLPTDQEPFPILLSEEELNHLKSCDIDLVNKIDSHKAKILNGWKMQVGSEPPEKKLLWANACVLSRCFHIWNGTAVSGKLRLWAWRREQDSDFTTYSAGRGFRSMLMRVLLTGAGVAGSIHRPDQPLLHAKL